ncbi:OLIGOPEPTIDE TRANSPORTER YGL114W-RELATED [Salix viminalis]|uniref:OLIGOPEPTIDE TRANSPORTER YGL114W-RELATED n=1 Tax=Salix viminalis TaxID=40686 RepID=A0A9Q0NNC3_SALVM|nr:OLIGOPEPTIDE TRANSPORTER YGL114W-RELATED [Salix viminalis]
MWPLIGGVKGEWFPSTLSESCMKSLNGYKVFISIALILGDGLYNFLKILYFTATKSKQVACKLQTNMNFYVNKKSMLTKSYLIRRATSELN